MAPVPPFFNHVLPAVASAAPIIVEAIQAGDEGSLAVSYPPTNTEMDAHHVVNQEVQDSSTDESQEPTPGGTTIIAS